MPADARRVKELFAAAVAADPAGRRALLDEQCRGDSDLRRRLDALLHAHDHPNTALERPLAAPPVSQSTVDRIDPTGTVINGRYKLLESIGEGGMGEVWVADQLEPMKRRVAIKVIKAGMDSKTVLARFEAERQALALMDHPNIARVLDAGTTAEGRPFFVMELVKGTPITTFCDVRKLTPRERLELFVPVCHAIQHAHTKGVIHRDIKPGNVLVELYDDRPVAKVIDFGVAKAVGQQLTDKTIYTGFGALVGTPAYMAPEQATFNALDVDTRADVYALGVLLYELLAGSPPFEPERLKRAALDEMLRVVREEDPPRPSTRLSTSESKATIAATRQSDPDALARLVRGELDWIVMKALEKDRTRRYETANSLARDVGRYLADERVEACPPTFGYRLRKFAHRHRTALATVVAFALLLAVGAIASVVLAVRAVDAEAATAAERDKTARQRDAAIEAGDQARAATDSLRRVEGDLRATRYVWDMQMVPTAWDAGNVPQARQLLARQPDDLRGFEWRYWDRVVNAERQVLKLPVARTTNRRWVMTPDGSKVVAAVPADARTKAGGGPPSDQLLKGWAADTGKELFSLALQQASGPANVSRVRFSHDGTRAAVSWSTARTGVPEVDEEFSPQRRVRVLDVSSGKALVDHQPPGEDVSQWTLSADGRRFAAVVRTAGPRGGPVVRVWDVDTGNVALTTPGDAGGDGPPFSPDGSKLAVSVGREVRVLDAATGAVLGKWNAVLNETPNLVFSPDGARVVGVLKTGSKDQWTVRVTVWEAATGQAVFTLDPPHPTVPRYVKPRLLFSDDGSRLAVSFPVGVNRGPETTVFDAADGRELFAFTSGGRNDAPAFTHDGKHLVTGERDGLSLRDATTGRVRHTFPVHGTPVEGYALSPDDKRLRAIESDGTLREWDARPPGPVAIDPPPGTREESLKLSPRGGRVAVVVTPQTADGSGATVRVWDTASGKEVNTFPLPLRPVSAASMYRFAFSADGRRLALARGSNPGTKSPPEGELLVWDMTTGARRTALVLPPVVYGLALTADGSRLAVAVGDGGANRQLKVHETDTGRPLLDAPATGLDYGLAFSPDGTRLAGTGGPAGGVTIRVWDAADGRVLQTFTPDGGGASPVWSPDGTRIAVGVRGANETGMLKVFDATTGGQVLSDVITGSRSVGAPAFSPDGTRIAAHVSGTAATEMRLWDAATGREVLTLKRSTPGRVHLAFRPDGHRLVEVGAVSPSAGAAPTPGGITFHTRDASPRPQGNRP